MILCSETEDAIIIPAGNHVLGLKPSADLFMHLKKEVIRSFFLKVEGGGVGHKKSHLESKENIDNICFIKLL